MKAKVDIFGAGSEISKSLTIKLRSHGALVRGYSREDLDFKDIELEHLISKVNLDSDYYIFTNGLLHSKRINEQSTREVLNSFSINLISIVRICDYVLDNNKKAKIIILGSESGKKGSYDTSYFLSKAALKKYVEERRLSSKEQQILMVSPSIIEDSGMTMRRCDVNNLDENRNNHPKGRFLATNEISSFISYIIVSECDYLSNCEVEINGGKFARMVYNE
ncbi:MAG: SDR family NAD(P)-dependent oxidoreductase [Cognaticolwellia sp.]